MSTVNTAVQVGVDAVNAARQSQVIEKAVCIINRIISHRKSIEGYRKASADRSTQLNALAVDVVSQSSLGLDLTGILNANQITIAKAIDKINQARQESVSLQSQSHINAIKANDATIAALEKEIAVWIEELNQLSVDVVTVTSVTGV